MEENQDTQTPLVRYAGNAKMVALATGIIGAVLALIASLSQADAQSKLADGMSKYSTLPSYEMSSLSNSATMAAGVLGIAEALLGVCAVAAVMWALARLAIAYKATK